MEQESGGPARARTHIAETTLPHSVPLRAVAGLGSGLACALCDAVIVDTESEFEVYFLSRPFEPYFFHARCYALWLARVVPGPHKVNVQHAA